MTPISEAFREGLVGLPRRLWGRAPQEVEDEDDSDSNSDNEDTELVSDPEDEVDEGLPVANAADIVNLPPAAGELKRQVDDRQANNINQPLPESKTSRTPLPFHTIGPDAPVLNLTPSTPAPTPQLSSSVVATRSAQVASSVTAAPAPAPPPALPSSNTLAASSALSDIATGVPSATTAVSTQADAEATAEAAAGAGGVDVGQVAGAAVGGVAGIALVATAIFFFKKRRRRPAEIISPTPSTKETIRRVPPTAAAGAMPRASAPLTPSKLKFNFNAPRLPRDQWPKSMEVLEGKVRAEFAAAQKQEQQGQGYGDQGYPGEAYGGQGYPGEAYGGQEYQGRGQTYQDRVNGDQDYYEARVYMR